VAVSAANGKGDAAATPRPGENAGVNGKRKQPIPNVSLEIIVHE
jgi:hypothetical protein